MKDILGNEGVGREDAAAAKKAKKAAAVEVKEGGH